MTQMPNQLAQEIGVPAEKVAEWADEFKIPLPAKYQRNALQVLQLVKDLKDKNCGFRTIQQQIQLDYPELKEEGDPFNNQTEEITQHFTSLRSELLELSELAEKYAQANYNIGQMSMRMHQLEQENNRLKAQLRVLPSPEDWESAQSREKTYKNLLQGLQMRIESLEDQVRDLLLPPEKQIYPEINKPILRSLPDLPSLEEDLRQLQLPFDQE